MHADECNTDGCRTIVEGKYPYCALREYHPPSGPLSSGSLANRHCRCLIDIKCEMNNCGRARHSVPKSKDYLAYCTDRGSNQPLQPNSSYQCCVVQQLTKPSHLEDATCNVARCKELKIEQSPYCSIHTCRERGCSKSSQRAPYCNDRKYTYDFQSLVKRMPWCWLVDR